MIRKRLSLTGVVILVLLAAACGGGGDSTPPPGSLDPPEQFEPDVSPAETPERFDPFDE